MSGGERPVPLFYVNGWRITTGVTKDVALRGFLAQPGAEPDSVHTSTHIMTLQVLSNLKHLIDCHAADLRKAGVELPDPVLLSPEAAPPDTLLC